MENGNLTYARNHQEKFEFYFVGLIFTVLALSVQSADKEAPWVVYCIEIISWGLLLMAGLNGLKRLEWLHVAFIQRGILDGEKALLKGYHEGLKGRLVVNEITQDELTEEEIQKRIDLIKVTMQKRQAEIEDKEGKLTKYYTVSQKCFSWGVGVLLVSRASHIFY